MKPNHNWKASLGPKLHSCGNVPLDLAMHVTLGKSLNFSKMWSSPFLV